MGHAAARPTILGRLRFSRVAPPLRRSPYRQSRSPGHLHVELRPRRPLARAILLTFTAVWTLFSLGVFFELTFPREAGMAALVAISSAAGFGVYWGLVRLVNTTTLTVANGALSVVDGPLETRDLRIALPDIIALSTTRNHDGFRLELHTRVDGHRIFQLANGLHAREAAHLRRELRQALGALLL